MKYCRIFTNFSNARQILVGFYNFQTLSQFPENVPYSETHIQGLRTTRLIRQEPLYPKSFTGSYIKGDWALLGDFEDWVPNLELVQERNLLHINYY